MGEKGAAAVVVAGTTLETVKQPLPCLAAEDTAAQTVGRWAWEARRPLRTVLWHTWPHHRGLAEPRPSQARGGKEDPYPLERPKCYE